MPHDDDAVAVFFYGLFMDTEMLLARGFAPSGTRHAVVTGYALRIGRRATLVARDASRVYGVVTFLRPDELDRLYADPSLVDYRPVRINAAVGDGETVQATAYVLPHPPGEDEANPEYAARLRDLCLRLKFPSSYVSSIR